MSASKKTSFFLAQDLGPVLCWNFSESSSAHYLIPLVGLAISSELGLQASRFYAQSAAGPGAVIALIPPIPCLKMALPETR